MIDGKKFLHFNPDRNLLFNVRRNLQFTPNRELQFNVDRKLMFDLNRDLPFGKRGIVFRGYVCPVCGGLVSPDAASCNECGVKFKVRQKKKSRQKVRSEPKAVSCPTCALKISRKSTFCPRCGTNVKKALEYRQKLKFQREGKATRDYSGTERIRLSPRKEKTSVTRDWNERY